MKKIIAIILAVCLLAALGACGAKKEKAEEAANAAADAAAEAAQQANLPNPMTEYASLEEINELTGGKLNHPAVMGVSDEKFNLIDCGEYQVAQYEYTVAGVPYVYRFSSNVTEDISGIYENGGPLFGAEIANETKEFEGGKAARFFNVDGQYVLIAEDEGSLSLETFQSIADEQRTIAGSFGEAEGMAAEFVGDWHEKIAGRGMMTVTAENEQLHFSVRWAGSYMDAYLWEFDGEVGADGTIEYTGGTRVLMEYDEQGKATEKERIEDNSGVISLDEEGNILWKDNDAEGSGEPSVFVKN